MEKITLNHGSGGRQMHELIAHHIAAKLKGRCPPHQDDAARLLTPSSKRLALTTDSYVVSPLFFPGGDIGVLAVCGTVNDLSTAGAIPLALTLSFILEEGLELRVLDRIIDSIADTAQKAGVEIVTGDTKVVEKGRGDGLYINTCGLGQILDGVEISSHHASPGDLVMITGPVGNHEVSLMRARQMVDFDIQVQSDVAPLNIPLQNIIQETPHLHCVKDPTRGGLASALYEIAQHSQVEIFLREDQIPVDREVAAVCELLGFDPLYLANEGKMVIVASPGTDAVVKKYFPQAAVIGEVRSASSGRLLMETISGGIRRMGMLETVQLPRIC